jgi:hypothetical protein
MHAAVEGFSNITGERGGKRFGPSESGRGEIGSTGHSLPNYSAEIPNFDSGLTAAL